MRKTVSSTLDFERGEFILLKKLVIKAPWEFVFKVIGFP